MALADVIKKLNKDFKTDLVTVGIQYEDIPRISFGSIRLDYMTYGGLPRGFLCEFAGEEGGGKTTTAVRVCAEAQKLFDKEYNERVEYLSSLSKPTKTETDELNHLKACGPLNILYADCENTFDDDWAQKQGLDTDRVIFLKPTAQCAEDVFESILQMVETGEIGLCVIDSLGVMVSSQAYSKTIQEKTYGGIAAPLTLFSKKAEMVCARTGCTIIGINQMRDDMNSPYGGTTTTGGRAWKHNCVLRLMFRKGRLLDDKHNEISRNSDEPKGNVVQVHIEKTKICKPDRPNGSYTLMYDIGIDYVYDLIDLCLQYQLILQGGAWFSIVNPTSGEVLTDENGTQVRIQGRGNIGPYLQQNPHILSMLETGIFSVIK